MNKKRYAIVRVDKDWCPYYADKEFIIPCSNFCENRFKCKDCRYGDTKEQLINKITTALRRTWLNEDNQSFQEVAEEIVEFLGVE